MFWRKKQMVTTPVEASPTGAPSPVVKTEKLPEPKPISDLLMKYLVTEKDKSPDWVGKLLTVERKSPKGEKAFDVRVFAGYEATEKRVNVKNYTSLDEHRELILFEGWFDKESKRVELEEKRVIPKIKTLTRAEIKAKIEELTEPGSSVFFYLSASPASGGPLGRGAGVVELNPKYPGKGQKKYILSAVPVKDLEPVGKGLRMFDSDKPKDIAGWIAERHQQSGG